MSEWRDCVRLGRKAWVSRQKRETWYLCCNKLVPFLPSEKRSAQKKRNLPSRQQFWNILDSLLGERGLYHTFLIFSIHISKHSCTLQCAPKTQCVKRQHIITGVKFELKSHNKFIYLCIYLYLLSGCLSSDNGRILLGSGVVCQWINSQGHFVHSVTLC